MLLVTIGTCEPFDRLLSAIDELDVDEELVVQTGLSTVHPRRASCFDFLAYDALADLVSRARVVVTHAGVGTILTVLAAGKRPIVVPRLRRYGDAVDDHQLELAERLALAGLVTHVQDPANLGAALAELVSAAPAVHSGGQLMRELQGFIAAHAA